MNGPGDVMETRLQVTERSGTSAGLVPAERRRTLFSKGWATLGRQESMQPLLVAGVVASGAGLLATVLVARLLTQANYGAFAKLLGVFLVLSLPGTALMVGVVRRVTAWRASGMDERVRQWVTRAHWTGRGVVAGLVFAIWLARSPLAQAMKLPGSASLVEVIAAGGVWILVAMDRGLLQSTQRYGALSVNIVAEGLGRTLGVIVLPAVGLGLQGAALGVLLGELTAAAHAMWALRKPTVHSGNSASDHSASEHVAVHSGGDLAADIVVAMVSMGLLAALQNIDVLVYGSRVPSHSGAYGAISVPSKALVFLALLMGNYLLPEASIQFQRGRHALPQLARLLAVLGVPAVVLLGFAAVMPGRFLSIVFGTKYEFGASGFWPLVLSMILLCVTNLLTVYLLAVGWRWVVVPLAAGTGLLVVLCLRASTSLPGTARADLVAQGALGVAMVAAFAFRHRRMMIAITARPPAETTDLALAD
jgi:O-antigen/teichoic acid export membrane protein